MSTPVNKDKYGNEDYPMLRKLHELAEKNLLPDDDHPDRPEILTEEELNQIDEEMKRKYGVKEDGKSEGLNNT